MKDKATLLTIFNDLSIREEQYVQERLLLDHFKRPFRLSGGTALLATIDLFDYLLDGFLAVAEAFPDRVKFEHPERPSFLSNNRRLGSFFLNKEQGTDGAGDILKFLSDYPESQSGSGPSYTDQSFLKTGLEYWYLHGRDELRTQDLRGYLRTSRFSHQSILQRWEAEGGIQILEDLETVDERTKAIRILSDPYSWRI